MMDSRRTRDEGDAVHTIYYLYRWIYINHLCVYLHYSKTQNEKV